MSTEWTDSIQFQWKSLVCDAAANCEYNLDEELESYLVFALMRFTQRPDLAWTTVALEYLEAVSEEGSQQVAQLRETGDKCLLYTGLFPQATRRKAMNIGYYVDMGRSSYDQLGKLLHKGFARLYCKLAEYFVFLTDVLHAMRELNGVPIMNQQEKYRFWTDFDSEYAFRSLKEFYGVIPVKPHR